MKKSNLTRKLMAACSVVALSAVMYGCSGSGEDSANMRADDAQSALAALQEAFGDQELTPGAIDDLQGALAMAVEQIGSADDADSLLGMIATEQAEVIRLSDLLGDETNPDADSVRGQLAAATARIGSDDDADSLLGMLAAERTTVEELNTRIAKLEAGEDPGQLEPIQTAGKTASDAAAAAETAAGAAADEAEAAMANRATMQTGTANSIADAYAARAAATTAMEEAAKALAAYNTAVAAGDVTAASAAGADADTAKGAAETAQTAAETARDDAVADAAAELKIDGTVKSVGDTMIDAEASSSVVTTDGTTVDTGLQVNDLQPQQMIALTPGADAVAPMPNADPVVAYSAPTAGVAATTLTLGKTVDDADDMARLMIITKYRGSDTVKVYASDVDATNTQLMGTKAGYISIEDDAVDGDEVDNVRLRSAGSYYFAEDDAELTAMEASVAEDAEAQRVYSYVSMADDPNTADTDETELSYLVLTSENTERAGGKTTTTYTYSAVDIHAATINHDADGDTPDITPEVTAKIPEATDYDHIHFGVWAGLGDAEKDGTQEIDDLGIGFVQNFSGGGMTGADMPNNGSADYTGNWVAAVQAADEDGNGDMSLETGVATIAADFGEGDITATLDELATLTGGIAGNTFDGTKAVATGSGLDASADFEGTFSGAFYGTKGAEAGGVFDFASDDGDNEGGAFRGAFGGTKD